MLEAEWPQDRRAEQRLARRSGPGPPPPAPARRLLAGGDYRPARRSGERQLAGAFIARVRDPEVAARAAEPCHHPAGRRTTSSPGESESSAAALSRLSASARLR